jgi:hypothetical protein
MTMPQDFQAVSEMNRLDLQASAANDGLDPRSLPGQQAAMGRGEPVQLVGEEGLSGVRFGVSTTANESVMMLAEGSADMTMPQDREAIAAEVQQQHADDAAAIQAEAKADAPATPPPPAKPATPAKK